jgi:tetratricopeptide (TPR) repeat protein
MLHSAILKGNKSLFATPGMPRANSNRGGIMCKRFAALLLMSFFVIFGCSGKKQESKQKVAVKAATAKDAYAEARKKRGETESIEEKLAITKDFLKEYPESDQTAGALEAAFYYQSDRLGDTEGAVAYAEGIRALIKDPRIGTEVDKELLSIYAGAGRPGKMIALAEKLAAADALSFDDRWNVIESAVKLGEWGIVQEYCAGAEAQATAEALRADNPGTDYTDEALHEAVNDRVGRLLVKNGWAQANLGRPDQALADFDKADGLIPRFYFDIPEYDLDIYWGKTLLEKKEYQEAIDKLAMSALVMRRDEALDGLKQAYAGLHSGDNGFEKFAAGLHIKIAPPAPDFEMPDYDGNRHRFADLCSDVTLLALWFPT